jgi:hypothetical protein
VAYTILPALVPLRVPQRLLVIKTGSAVAAVWQTVQPLSPHCADSAGDETVPWQRMLEQVLVDESYIGIEETVGLDGFQITSMVELTCFVEPETMAVPAVLIVS